MKYEHGTAKADLIDFMIKYGHKVGDVYIDYNSETVRSPFLFRDLSAPIICTCKNCKFRGKAVESYEGDLLITVSRCVCHLPYPSEETRRETEDESNNRRRWSKEDMAGRIP